MWAVVPLKSPAAAKTRLSEALSPVQRRELFFLMARQVIGSLLGAPGIARVAVITASEEVADFAESLGAWIIREEREAGTAAACRAAVAAAVGRTPSLLMMSGDLPLASTAAIEPLARLGGRSPLVAIVGDRRRQGTNALLCSPPDVIPMCFGPDSFRRHVAARRPEVALEVVDSDALSLDIDDEQDLHELQRRALTGAAPGLDALRAVFAADGRVLVE